MTLDEMVRRALDELPSEFRERLDNLAIVVEDAASPRDNAQAGVRGRGVLLGVYRGIPLTARYSLAVTPPALNSGSVSHALWRAALRRRFPAG